MFRVRSKTYWINTDENSTIISETKEKYLDMLDERRKTSKLAEAMDVTWKSAHRRLNELARLGLVERNSNKLWRRIPTEKKVIVL